MNEKNLKKLLKDENKLNKKIIFYLRHKTISKVEPNINETKGHLEKAEHNVNFITDSLGMGYSDWSVVGCYYAVYHAALSLILQKGYFSKNHDATLCLLIKEYCEKGLAESDIELMNIAYLNYEDMLFYVKSKEEREKASYSTQIIFDKNGIEELKKKTLLFVRKAQEILKSQ